MIIEKYLSKNNRLQHYSYSLTGKLSVKNERRMLMEETRDIKETQSRLESLPLAKLSWIDRIISQELVKEKRKSIAINRAIGNPSRSSFPIRLDVISKRPIALYSYYLTATNIKLIIQEIIKFLKSIYVISHVQIYCKFPQIDYRSN